MEEPIHRVVDKLAKAASLEAAAEAILGTALEVVEGALAGSSFSGSARVLRALIHLRPDDGYVCLLHRDAAGAEVCKTGDADGIASATAWRWVKKHDTAVAVDVGLGMVTLASGGTLNAVDAPQPFNAEESRVKLASRAVTHLYAVPLRAPGRRIDGMLAIEAECREAMGTMFVWPSCGPALATLATMGAPYLEHLPATRVEPTSPDELLPVIGDSMQRLVEMLRVFSRQGETILLGGPTGAGKSRLARWCHEQSPARGSPFETLDLATVPEELQMAELFGWRKGAFTHATRDTPGAVARAENGTLFIDEVDKLSLRAQAGLLRVLEDKRYRMIGDGAGDQRANVRFIIGTNADLFELAEKGAFRADLYYRINVLPVKVPPLRERRDEIVDWANYMLRRRHGASTGQVIIAPEAAERLAAHDWPGNLRQLDNIVRRAYTLWLMNHQIPPERVVLGIEHVEEALRHEGGSAPHAPTSLLSHLERTAEAFVTEAEVRDERGQPALDMDVADALKGFVLEAAVRRCGGDVRRAFVLLGKGATVDGRNHGAAHKREVEKAKAARIVLRGGAPTA